MRVAMLSLLLAILSCAAQIDQARGQAAGGSAGSSAGGVGSRSGSESETTGRAMTLGTDKMGAAQSSGGASPRGSTTVGRPGNLAGGTSSGRIDGTVTTGPSRQGDDQIRSESSQDSKADRKIKSICRGC